MKWAFHQDLTSIEDIRVVQRIGPPVDTPSGKNPQAAGIPLAGFNNVRASMGCDMPVGKCEVPGCLVSRSEAGGKGAGLAQLIVELKMMHSCARIH